MTARSPQVASLAGLDWVCEAPVVGGRVSDGPAQVQVSRPGRRRRRRSGDGGAARGRRPAGRGGAASRDLMRRPDPAIGRGPAWMGHTRRILRWQPSPAFLESLSLVRQSDTLAASVADNGSHRLPARSKPLCPPRLAWQPQAAWPGCLTRAAAKAILHAPCGGTGCRTACRGWRQAMGNRGSRRMPAERVLFTVVRQRRLRAPGSAGSLW